MWEPSLSAQDLSDTSIAIGAFSLGAFALAAERQCIASQDLLEFSRTADAAQVDDNVVNFDAEHAEDDVDMNMNVDADGDMDDSSSSSLPSSTPLVDGEEEMDVSGETVEVEESSTNEEMLCSVAERKKRRLQRELQCNLDGGYWTKAPRELECNLDGGYWTEAPRRRRRNMRA